MTDGLRPLTSLRIAPKSRSLVKTIAPPSRANSSAARTSTLLRYGYRSSTSSTLWPAASKPRRVPTVTRVPRTHGFPPMRAESKVTLPESMIHTVVCPEHACKRIRFQWGRALWSAEKCKPAIHKLRRIYLQWGRRANWILCLHCYNDTVTFRKF